MERIKQLQIEKKNKTEWEKSCVGYEKTSKENVGIKVTTRATS